MKYLTLLRLQPFFRSIRGIIPSPSKQSIVSTNSKMQQLASQPTKLYFESVILSYDDSFILENSLCLQLNHMPYILQGNTTPCSSNVIHTHTVSERPRDNHFHSCISLAIQHIIIHCAVLQPH